MGFEKLHVTQLHPETQQKWKVIISDDDEEVHAVTRLALEDFSFEGKGLEFLSAYSGEETQKLIAEHPDTALLLLDVVMEKENSGLEVVEYIRKELLNSFVRIVLRTGQPGRAPQMQVIRDLDINDYKEKVELTDQKLYTTIVASIRSYRDMKFIEASLKEKEVLLKEIHHRVKNNLQVISSLLSMQASTVSDEKILAMFQDSRNRVSSIALIHEKLYQSKNFSDIDFGDYLRTMAEELFTIFNAAERIRFSLDCDNVTLSMTSAIPCGLIVNEVLTNALKYAFPDDKEGEFRIKLGIENNDVKLSLADDGVGIPESINLDNTDTLGMKLIQILTDQLHGTIELDRKGGTRYNLRFPREDL